MPRYQVTAPDGRTVTLEGDSPPTDADLEEIFASLPRSEGQSPQGFQAAAAGAETIGEAPLATRNIGGLPSITQALAALPGIGGLLGGVLGGGGGPATALGGAALGGGAGEAFSQLGFRALGGESPATSTEAAKGIGSEAAKQAVMELLGRGMAGGVKALGRGMVEQSVRPTITMQGEFPNIIETIIKERLPVGAKPFGKTKGSEMAAQRLAEESRAVKDTLAASGKTFDPITITAKPLKKLAGEVARDEAQNPGGTQALQELVDNFMAQKVVPASGMGPVAPAAMSALEVQQMKQTGQKIAKPIYKAVARGENVGTEQNLKAQFNAALSSGAKQAMETIPGVAEGEAKKQGLIGAQRALRRAEERRLSLMAESASGIAGALGGALSPGGGMDDKAASAVLMWGLTRGILHPRQLSRAGLALTNDQALALLKQFPRLADTALSVAQAGGESAPR